MTGEKIPAAEPVEALAFGDGESVIGGGRGSIEIQTWEDGEVSVFVCDNGVQGQCFTLLAEEVIQLARALRRFLPVGPHPPADLAPLDFFEPGGR